MSNRHIHENHLHSEHASFDGAEFKIVRSAGQANLTVESDTTLTTADTAYALTGDFTDSSLNTNFTTTSNGGRITYNGNSEKFIFNGTADINSNKACELKVVLYKNGSAISTVGTTHTFVASNKVSTIAITSFVEASTDDYFEVYLESDTANTIISAKSFNYNLVQI